ncbi:MAG: hypothetical protein HDR88_05285 [Bacteroides sp.]|nr:hypothetical protein [Bacteroides sp.]
MNDIKKNFIAAVVMLLPLVALGGSPKRGICWEEGKVNLNEHHASLLAPGVAWVYNWGSYPANPEVYSDLFCFVPMAWNGEYDAAAIRSWLVAHPETRYLLGFNEPNFADQAKMTPSQAAAAWPGLEAIAEEFEIKLVAPALNFSGSQVGGKVWGIYEWYDEFFRLYPEAHVDCLALHCYMNWYTATTWFATEYIYKDLYTPTNENFGKYPNLVKFLDDFKDANGHFPRMMLTEFCGWEYDYLPDVYFQIDQMTQKVQKLEQSDMIEGYAWFIGNSNDGASAFPYMSVFQDNSATSQLSELGNAYVNMSAFDNSRYYMPGETIMAKDYINATTDNEQVKVRTNSEISSSIPLQIEIPRKGASEYLINVPINGTYSFTVHYKTNDNSTLSLDVDSIKNSEVNISDSNGNWTDLSIITELSSGQHTIKIYNSGSASVIINALNFTLSSGIDTVLTDDKINVEIFNMQGLSIGNPVLDNLEPGIYIVKKANGELIKILK